MLTKVQLAPTPEEKGQITTIEAVIDDALTNEWVEGKRVEVWVDCTTPRVAAEIRRIYRAGGWKIACKDLGDQVSGMNTVFILK